MRTLLKGRANVLAACSLVNAKKSCYAGGESESYWISQAESRMQGKERGRAKMFWIVQPFRRLRHEMLYEARVNAVMGAVMEEKVIHAT